MLLISLVWNCKKKNAVNFDLCRFLHIVNRREYVDVISMVAGVRGDQLVFQFSYMYRSSQEGTSGNVVH